MIVIQGGHLLRTRCVVFYFDGTEELQRSLPPSPSLSLSSSELRVADQIISGHETAMNNNIVAAIFSVVVW
jgi:hypothetical protein